jgi:CheY-like chemotaxis protein
MKSKPTVLIVEDEPRVRAEAVEQFTELGVEVIHTYSGERALTLLAERPEIRLVFSDVRLPGRDGFTLAKTVHEKHPDVLVVLTSGYFTGSPINGVGFVAKPWPAGALAGLVREIGRD